MMKRYYKICIYIVLALLLVACADKQDNLKPMVIPTGRGTFTDSRDGLTYNWVRYGRLEWTVENSQFDTGNRKNCTIYQSYGWEQGQPLLLDNAVRYGYLYTIEGAKLAVPTGWRLPTDEDWKALEQELGMSAAQANALDWRGEHVADLMKHTSSERGLDIKMSGYFTPYTVMATSGYRFMGSYAFLWTATKDEAKEGEYYFYRKLLYNSGQVYRESMEPNQAMLSVRFVRDVAAQ